MAFNLAEHINKITTNQSRIKVQKGNYLFKEGDSNEFVYFLLNGEIGALKKGCKLWTLNSRELIGVASFFSSTSTYHYSAKAAINSQVIAIDNALFALSISTKPAFSKAVMEMLCERIESTSTRIKSILETSTKTRLIQEILLKYNNSKNTILQCSLEELSENICVSPRIIRQTLSKLETNKILEYKDGILKLTNPSGLKMIGESFTKH